MALTWLHLSDFHIKAGDGYDRDVVLKALVASVREFREAGRRPDVVFATGDIAFSGQPAQYELATTFFDELLDAADIGRECLFVIAGNHDVDRDQGVGLARTLTSREEADAYFAPRRVRPQLTQKQGAFLAWHDAFFAGVREASTSSCAGIEVVEAGGIRLGVLAINSALFCQDDNDHAKLWVGRRALEEPLAELSKLEADARIVLVHHPLDWLSDAERSHIRAALAKHADVVLRGHLHETDVEHVISPAGGLVHLAAGAAYQTRLWPNRAMYVTLERQCLDVFPIRYEDSPTPVWTVDPSVFPANPGYSGRLPLSGVPDVASAPVKPEAIPVTPFRTNVPSRRGLEFVGREAELAELDTRLGGGDPPVVVVSGPPGVGKSELAREYARRHPERYSGGTFFIDATSAAAPVDLSRIAANHLGVEFGGEISVEDQCEQALNALAAAPALLIYDNVSSFAAIERWLPRAGTPCHVVLTSIEEPREPGWSVLLVDPLDDVRSIQLIEALAGSEIARTFGEQLAEDAGGLPVQLCPAAATLAYERRRGRTPKRASMAGEAHASFSAVYERLGSAERLLLHAATGLDPQRISRAELASHLESGAGWTDRD